MEYWHDDLEALRYCERLKKILEDAIQLRKEYESKIWDNNYRRQRESLARAMKDFGFPNPNIREYLNASPSALKDTKSIFFLYKKNIDYHNNHAEQQIRPDVIFRKINFGIVHMPAPKTIASS